MSDKLADIQRRWEHVASHEHHRGSGCDPCIRCPGVPAIADIGVLLGEVDAALNARDAHQRNYASAVEREYAANRRIAELEALLMMDAKATDYEHVLRYPKAGKCDCGLHEVPRAISGVQSYWQRHSREGCTLELPDKLCWCGLKRSEHITGHAEKEKGDG
ncbi:MAG: hypothetical protein WBH61_10535 [Candidatus Methylomirabilis sp.]